MYYCTTSPVRSPRARQPRVCGVAETKDLCLRNKVKKERTLKTILRFPPKGCGARALPHVTIRKGERGEWEETLLSYPQSTWCQIQRSRLRGSWHPSRLYLHSRAGEIAQWFEQ